MKYIYFCILPCTHICPHLDRRCARCKYINRYNCRFRVLIRPDIDSDTLDVEASTWSIYVDGGGHIHDFDKENQQRGLPQRYRDAALIILKVNPMITPSILGNQVCTLVISLGWVTTCFKICFRCMYSQLVAKKRAGVCAQWRHSTTTNKFD